jgi:diguanylate cyclase (GGDEF)-like protein/PAS domain S-box-containing protein
LTQAANFPKNEQARLLRLRQLKVLDTSPEPVFDVITQLAREVCDVQYAAISLVDQNRQWFKSVIGLDGLTETSRDIAMCAHAILENQLMVVEDTGQDQRFSANPLVLNAPNIQFYAAAPLTLSGDLNVGTLCVIDTSPKQLNALQKKMLSGLAKVASEALLVRERAINEIDSQSGKLAVIVQSSEDAIVSKTMENIVTTWNAGAEKLFGYSAQEMLGHSMVCLISPDRMDDESQLLSQLKNNINIQHHETQYLHRNGACIHVAVSLSGIKNPQGEVVEISEIIRDITQQKEMQHALHVEHALLKVTMDSIGDAVLTTDNNGLVQYLNPVAEQLTGWKADEAIGQPSEKIFRVINEKTRKPCLNPVAMCLSENSIVALADETLLMSRDGQEYGIEESASPIRDVDGQTLGVVMVFHDVSEQRKVANEMSYRASHDTLTGLSNRSEFEQALKRFVDNNREPDQINALMYIDLDQFKIVNDSCGHSAGDLVLQDVAKLMKNCVRSSDLIARIGGDEFAIILSKCDTEKSMKIAKKICKSVSDYRFHHDNKIFKIGASVGLVMINTNWESEARLMEAADSACYQAKRTGRGRVHLYFDETHTVQLGQGEIQWASRIEQALEEKSFVLFCQRIMPLSHQGLEHAEILIRMKDKSGALIPPSAFFPAAERFNMASRIDKWVVKEVFEWMNINATSLDHIESLSVNLSGQSLGDLAFHNYVINLIEKMRIDCSKLCFEVTETSAITNITDAKKFIDAMNRHGVKFSLDDFGSGVSSFGYLKNLSVDYLKIDGQFISDLVDNKVGQATVRCITEVAKATGKQTIAEWVDNKPVENLLKQMGVDFTQGYLKHKPAPISFMLETNCSYMTH